MLPDWYWGWILANPSIEIKDRPAEFVFKAIQARKKLKDLIDNKIIFCLINPDKVFDECLKLIEDIKQIYKILTSKKKEENAPIQRYLTIGISDKTNKYKDWHDLKMKNLFKHS